LHDKTAQEHRPLALGARGHLCVLMPEKAGEPAFMAMKIICSYLGGGSPMKSILGLTVVLTLVGVTIALLVIFWQLPEASRPELLLEVAQTLLRLSLVAVVGNALTWMYDEIAEERRKADIEKAKELERLAGANELRKTLCNDFQRVCSEAKSELRLRTVIQPKGPFGKYDSAIGVWHHLRPELDRVSYELEAAPGLFSNHTRVQDHIQAIASSLDEVLKEYACTDRDKLRDVREEQLLKQTPEYARFHASLEQTFLNPWHAAVSLMREDILGSNHRG